MNLSASVVLLAVFFVGPACRTAGGPVELRISVPKDTAPRYVRFSDLAILDAEGVTSVTLSPDHPYFAHGGVHFDFEVMHTHVFQIVHNRSRNLSPVGTANEVTFRSLVSSLETWELLEVDQNAKTLGIELDDLSGYWSSHELDCVEGIVVAVRFMGDNEFDRVEGLLFVKSIAGDGDVVVLLARGPWKN